MLAIRLRPVGRKKQISYRVVVDQSRSKLKGRFVEDLGFYNPRSDQFSVNQHRAEYWIGVGAQPTDTVHNLFITAKIIEGKKRAVHAKSKKKAEDAGTEAPTADANAKNEVPATNESAVKTEDAAPEPEKEAQEEKPEESTKEESAQSAPESSSEPVEAKKE